MKSNTNHDDQEARARFALRETFVSEPDLDDCRPREKWRLRFLKLQLTGKHEIEIEFRTRDDQWQMLRVENWRRSEFDTIRKELDAHNACLPSKRKDAVAFVEELIRQTPTVPFIACASPQFCNRATGFVMPYRQYGTAYGAYLWDDETAPPEFGKRKGDLATYQRTVLRTALSSPYVSLAIMIALAGPLVDYVEQRRGRQLLTETAIILFVGEVERGEDDARARRPISRRIADDRDGLRGDRPGHRGARPPTQQPRARHRRHGERGTHRRGDSREDAQVCPPRAARSLQGDFEEGLEV